MLVNSGIGIQKVCLGGIEIEIEIEMVVIMPICLSLWIRLGLKELIKDCRIGNEE